MSYDLKNFSTVELVKELQRRKELLENNHLDLSAIPIEYIISEYSKRATDFEKAANDVKDIIKEESHKKIPIDTSEQKILLNAIKTPDGTFLSSRHRHDYVTHTDAKTGKIYGVDGGADYFRMTGDTQDCEDCTITTQTSFDVVRTRFHWGSYGKNGDKQKTERRLKEISNSHLEAILTNINFPSGSHFKKFFEMEKEYRKKENIFIDEY
jgi:hypothetical protein